jgi:peptide/nickel transport system substrate-binding protein
MEDYSDNTENIRSRGLGAWWASLMTDRRARRLDGLEGVLRNFSPSERLFLYLLATILGLSTLILLAGLNTAATVSIPASGGSLTEGEVGPTRFINPLLTLSQPDQDLTALVYSGLMRALPDGSVVPDLAASYTISNDGRVYTFKLRTDATFHDGTQVAAADVLYTIAQAQNPSINSPRRADWVGVVASSPDPSTIVFTLPHAYAPFIENTTLGILPKHLWENTSAEEFPFSPLNTHPIGSGPYKISNVATDATGAAVRYDLVPFSHFTLGTPFLSRISFVFFPNTEALVKALNAGQIDAVASLAPGTLSSLKRSDSAAASVPLPRVFGVFFNQSKNVLLADPSVRGALDAAVDKQDIINKSLDGQGVALDGPIPPGLLGQAALSLPAPIGDIHFPLSTTTASATGAHALDALQQNARSILQKGGWTWDAASGSWQKNKKTLSFTLATANQPELVQTAHALSDEWKAAGITVSVQIYPLSELNTSVIRPRAYDALLFGEVVGPELDLYAFWHSSQRNDPGLNLAMYANAKTDALLAQARATTDAGQRDKLYGQFAGLLVKDTPAIFLYAPDFLYVVPTGLHGVALGALTAPADRFSNVYRWYTETEHVWAIFAPANDST